MSITNYFLSFQLVIVGLHNKIRSQDEIVFASGKARLLDAVNQCHLKAIIVNIQMFKAHGRCKCWNIRIRRCRAYTADSRTHYSCMLAER